MRIPMHGRFASMLMASMLMNPMSDYGYSEPKYRRPEPTGHRTAKQQARRKKNRIANKSRAINFKRNK